VAAARRPRCCAGAAPRCSDLSRYSTSSRGINKAQGEERAGDLRAARAAHQHGCLPYPRRLPFRGCTTTNCSCWGQHLHSCSCRAGDRTCLALIGRESPSTPSAARRARSSSAASTCSPLTTTWAPLPDAPSSPREFSHCNAQQDGQAAFGEGGKTRKAPGQLAFMRPAFCGTASRGISASVAESSPSSASSASASVSKLPPFPSSCWP